MPPGSPRARTSVDRAAVVAHVEPFALVLRRRVHRERPLVERVRDEERDHLLRELERPVVVGAVRDRRLQPERLAVSAHIVVRGRLRGVVRRARAVRRVLAERLVRVEREVAVDLARRDVVETPGLGLARRLEQQLRAEDVRAREQAWIDDGEAVVRLGREVDDDVDRVLEEHVLDQVDVRDVRLDERDALLRALEVRAVSGVRQKVERDDRVVRVPLEPVVHEVGADEPGRAGDEDLHGGIVRVTPRLPGVGPNRRRYRPFVHGRDLSGRASPRPGSRAGCPGAVASAGGAGAPRRTARAGREPRRGRTPRTPHT